MQTGWGHCKPEPSCSHLIDLLLVEVKNLSRGGGSNLLIDPVAGVGTVPTIPGQHKHHLGGKRGAWELWRLVPARCLLSAHSFPVGCKATLTLIVMLWRGVSDWGTLKTLFSPVERWGTPLEWRFFTAWPVSFVIVCEAKLFKRQVRYKKTHISRILRHKEDKLTDYCVTQRVSGLYWRLNGLIIT